MLLVSSEDATRRVVGVGAVLSGGGVRLHLKAFPARAAQLPARNSPPVCAGQDRSR